MKHVYHIHGMTCNGCRSHVEQTLSKVDGVTNASVDLEKAEATIEMQSHIPIETFQNVLRKKAVHILFMVLEKTLIRMYLRKITM